MASDGGGAHREGREHFRLLAHRPVLALERPQHKLLGTGGGKPLATHGPCERAHTGGVAGHPHVLGIDDAPAVQRRLLHGCHQELPVRAEGRMVVRALPLQHLRRSLGVRKPERHAVVVGDGQTHAFRREGQAANGGLHLDRARLALAGLHESLFAGRPGHRTVGARGDVIDPAALRVGRNRPAFALRIGREHLAVIAAGNDRDAVGRGRQNAAPVDRQPLLVALVGDQQHRLLAEHKGRRAAEQMHRHHRRAGYDHARAFNDGRGVGYNVSWSISHDLSPPHPEERALARLEGWAAPMLPSFETHRFAMLLRMRPLLKQRRSRNLCGSSLPAAGGR